MNNLYDYWHKAYERSMSLYCSNCYNSEFCLFNRECQRFFSENPNFSTRIRIISVSFKTQYLNIVYPQVDGLINQVTLDKMNEAIDRTLNDCLKQHFIFMKDFDEFTITGKYKVTVNKNNVLGLNFQFYSIGKMAANGIETLNSLTFDISTGSLYGFSDLFKPDSQYEQILSDLVRQQIKDKNIPTISEYPGVSKDQQFYLTPNALVLYYPALTFTPHYVGIPEFVIAFDRIKAIINPDGPIAKLMA